MGFDVGLHVHLWRDFRRTCVQVDDFVNLAHSAAVTEFQRTSTSKMFALLVDAIGSIPLPSSASRFEEDARIIRDASENALGRVLARYGSVTKREMDRFAMEVAETVRRATNHALTDFDKHIRDAMRVAVSACNKVAADAFPPLHGSATIANVLSARSLELIEPAAISAAKMTFQDALHANIRDAGARLLASVVSQCHADSHGAVTRISRENDEMFRRVAAPVAAAILADTMWAFNRVPVLSSSEVMDGVVVARKQATEKEFQAALGAAASLAQYDAVRQQTLVTGAYMCVSCD